LMYPETETFNSMRPPGSGAPSKTQRDAVDLFSV
jgi:hypothetical protein